MPLKAKYCSQCGAEVTVRVVDDRQREVCTSCDTVFYQNPLPVAGSVVLNENREVLLVKRKREPKKGMWCLPIGFAEVNETIADAACRELKEETGVKGQVMRLLDAGSFENDFYGDLLIVTFELQKIGGAEQAGDDAEKVSYFPLNWLPPLAFSANEKALEVCAKLH
ncbi:MAG: NUDIX hydrolase, partial [Planctomycetes bacterium]|nr:NUDIX hydrolase [Planctomycetota bacterium]